MSAKYGTRKDPKIWIVTQYVAKCPTFWQEIATSEVAAAIQAMRDENGDTVVIRVAAMFSESDSGKEIPAARWLREHAISGATV